ncbi:hypothetical protein [Psychromonas ossibalaenae]|uniref:hypothetical protein n=1 Tax=Psychromonas ossibalaenae TaxID=444922 RepID=UPI00037B0039|nr:hypothetical protein [Psychromonas ossibalaenae]
MNTLLGSIASGLIAVLVGHRLILSKDKRKEYNEAVIPLLSRLLKHKDELSQDMLINRIEDHSIDNVKFFISNRNEKKLMHHFKLYSDLCRVGVKNNAFTGLTDYKPGLFNELIFHVDGMLSTIKRK